MLGSAILDVVIGVVFVFVLVSTLCTSMREGIESILKTRAAYLEHGIRELLQDPQLTEKFFGHPLISNLFRGPYRTASTRFWVLAWGGNLPSYIPARNFALALLDVATQRTNGSAAPSAPLSFANARAGLAKLPDGPLRTALAMLLDSAQGDLDRGLANIEDWFDSSMDRVSGWYKRSTQWINLFIALSAALLLNIDAIAIAEFLYQNDAARQAVVARAEAYDARLEGEERDAEARRELDELALPIGWAKVLAAPGCQGVSEPDHACERCDSWPYRLRLLKRALGILATALAATLGAPFWFDVLNKFVVIRSTVKPHEKSPEEGSEDRGDRKLLLALATRAAPPTTPSHDDRHDLDACGGEGDGEDTPDEDLPPAVGGVAAQAPVGGG